MSLSINPLHFFSMFNKPAKFEKQLSRGAMTVSNGVSHAGSPTGVISKSVVQEVQSVNDEESQKVLKRKK